MQTTNGIKYISSNLLERAGVAHAFLSRVGGASSTPFDTLNFDDRDADTKENIAENNLRVRNAFGIATPVATVNQVHGKAVFHLDPSTTGTKADADAIITRLRGVAVGVLTADCVPILVLDPVREAVAAIHAGWKGTVKLIAKETVDAMRANFNSDAGDLAAAIGPHIGPCCYTVGAEVADEFRREFGENPACLEPTGTGAKADLGEANVSALLSAGLKRENISFDPVCTSCNNSLFFSYRKDNGRTGRQLSFIALR